MQTNDSNVVIVNYTGRKGGGALDAFEMAKALLSNGKRVIPIISNQIENIEEWRKEGFETLIEIDTYSTKINYLINSFFFFFKQRRQIKKAIKDYSIDFVYCPMITLWTGKINSFFKKSRTIIAVHDPIAHSGSNAFGASYLNRPYKKASALVVHSKKFVEYVEKTFNKPTFYIPLGTHDFYKRYQPKGLKKNVSNNNRINFLFFGRIEQYKGLDVLAKAFERLVKKYGNLVSLSIVGNGSFSNYSGLYNGIKNTSIVNKWIPDNEVYQYFMNDLLVCVCPYVDATQSGVILVSYAFETPVIATKTGGMDEQVLDNKTGYLIEPKSIDELFLAMERFVNKPSIIFDMRKNIMDYLDSISWSKSAQMLLSTINSKGQ